MRKMHCSKSMRFHIVFANVKTMVWLREVISVSRLSGRLAKACQSGRQGLSLKIEIKFPGTGFAGHAIPKSIVCCAHRPGFKQHPPCDPLWPLQGGMPPPTPPGQPLRFYAFFVIVFCDIRSETNQVVDHMFSEADLECTLQAVQQE